MLYFQNGSFTSTYAFTTTAKSHPRDLLSYNKSILWGYGSDGRAMRSQRIGHGFESRYLHHNGGLDLFQAFFVAHASPRSLVRDFKKIARCRRFAPRTQRIGHGYLRICFRKFKAMFCLLMLQQMQNVICDGIVSQSLFRRYAPHAPLSPPPTAACLKSQKK